MGVFSLEVEVLLVDGLRRSCEEDANPAGGARESGGGLGEGGAFLYGHHAERIPPLCNLTGARGGGDMPHG